MVKIDVKIAILTLKITFKKKDETPFNKSNSKKEKKIAEEKLRKQTLDVDYLAPFLALKGITEKQPIRPQDAIELKERCLADLKNRLIDNANLIQKRFETVNNFIKI